MANSTITSAWLCGAAGVVLLAALPAGAQSRKSARFTTSKLREIGEGTSVHRFQNYSYGVGSLGSYSSSSPGGTLRSSMASGGFSLRRSNSFAQTSTGVMGSLRSTEMGITRNPTGLGLSGKSVGTGLDLRVPGIVTGPTVAPRAPGSTLIPLPGALDKGGGVPSLGPSLTHSSIGEFLAGQDDTVFGAARAYVQALEMAATSKLRDQRAPITSLVPKPPSPYRDYMLKGDRAFRTNNFHGAYTYFQIASDLGGGDPESLISLTHTQFALSHHSYAKASYFLQKAIKQMPELPLANLRPRGFYGHISKYATQLDGLQEHLKRSPQDREALLMLAYFRWFGQAQDVRTTHNALARALAAALATKDTHLVEAVETFWDGMVKTGKVSGKLEPAKLPAKGQAALAK